MSLLVRNNTSEDLVTLLHCDSKHWNSQKHRTSTISIVGGCVHKHKGLQVLEQSHCYIWSHHLMQLTTRSRRFLARAVLLGKWQGRKRLHFVKFLQLQQTQRWHFRGVFLGRVDTRAQSGQSRAGDSSGFAHALPSVAED